MIKKYLEFIGFGKNETPYRREKYAVHKDLKMAKSHLKYLEDLKQTQDNRQQTIEAKNSQIMGQSSIVISIVSLFIPILATQFEGLAFYVKIPLILVFLFLVIHFIISLHHALKTLQVDKTRYMEGSTSTVTKENRATSEKEFIDEQIKDLVLIINYNNSVTNLSASNLVFASRNFRIAIMSFLFFILSLMISFFSLKETISKVVITNIKDLKSQDSFKKTYPQNNAIISPMINPKKERAKTDSIIKRSEGLHPLDSGKKSIKN